MADASFGRGYPNCSSSPIVTLVRKDGLRIPLHRDMVNLVSILMDLTEMAYGYDIVPGWTWGYACRAIRGTNQPSNHSWGTAVDINAPKNPMGSTLITDIPPKVRDLWKAQNFRWGGDYRTRPDAMHFEFMGTAAEARDRYNKIVAFLNSASTPPPPSLRVDVKTMPTLREGSRGTAVKQMQAMLKNCAGQQITVDGAFGPATKKAVINVQKFFRMNIINWGVCGPKTWGVLNYACSMAGK